MNKFFLGGMSGFLAATILTVRAPTQRPSAKPQVLQQAQTTITYTAATDVAALIERAKTERKEGTPLVVGKILQLAPYTAFLEYRDAKSFGDVGTHPKDAQLDYVIEGSGTLVTGGTVTADGQSIEGGESRLLSKGDLVMIPEGTPHGFTHVDQTFVLMSIHIPRQTSAK